MKPACGSARIVGGTGGSTEASGGTGAGGTKPWGGTAATGGSGTAIGAGATGADGAGAGALTGGGGTAMPGSTRGSIRESPFSRPADAAPRTMLDSMTRSFGPPIITRCSTWSRRRSVDGGRGAVRSLWPTQREHRGIH